MSTCNDVRRRYAVLDYITSVVFALAFAASAYMSHNDEPVAPVEDVKPQPPEPSHDEEPLYDDDELVVCDSEAPTVPKCVEVRLIPQTTILPQGAG